MNWGIELWDKYDDLVSHTNSGIDFLEKSVAEFIKERGRVEKLHAKNLRELVKRFMPKGVSSGNPKNTNTNGANSESGPASIAVRAEADEEYTHLLAYKEMLLEVGFQAGQHEILADAFSKDIAQQIFDEAKQMKKNRQTNMKQSKKISDELTMAFKTMTAAKDKFRRAYDEQVRATEAYKKSDAEGNISRNDLNKLKESMNSKTQFSDSMKQNYASQLVKTNEIRTSYYYEKLPTVINKLQDLEKNRIELIRTGILDCISKEREVMPIVNKCQGSIQSAMEEINPDKDTDIVIEKYKSGDVPPADFNSTFGEMSDPRSLLDTDALAQTGPTNFNWYPRKKELERQMAGTQNELNKSHKELNSLHQMMQTYQKQPKFGDSKKFQKDIQRAEMNVKHLEDRMTSLKAEHAQVERSLEELKQRFSPRPPGGGNSSFNRGPSQTSSGGSIASSSETSSNQGIYDIPSVPHYDIGYVDDTDDNIPPPPPPPPMPGIGGMSISDDNSVSTRSISPSVSPAPSSIDFVGRCRALYDYSNANMEESQIPMHQGEEFMLIESDCDGWTRVRRAFPNPQYGADEGFVPSTWIEMI